MTSQEVDHIMHIMYNAVNNGESYVEDYYFQAFVNKHCPGRNDALFEPQALRDLSCGISRIDPSVNVKYAPLEGLGKIVYTNIKAPRVLLDFSTPSPSTLAVNSKEGDETETPQRPLDQEPLLAARIMVEDCMSLLLDVDDIDRKVKAARARVGGLNAPLQKEEGGGTPSTLSAGMQAEDTRSLNQRRSLLLSGIISSFHLPTLPIPLHPQGQADTAYAFQGQTDGVFQSVMMLSKGRKMLSRVILALCSSDPAPQATPQAMHLLYATLRNVNLFFGTPSSSLPNSSTSFLFYLTGSSPIGGGSDASSALADASSLVAHSIVIALQRMPMTPGEITSCLEALTYGLMSSSVQKKGSTPLPPTASILPLIRTNKASLPSSSGMNRSSSQLWLGEIIIKVMNQGQELMAHPTSHQQPGLGYGLEVMTKWQSASIRMAELMIAHLNGVAFIHSAAAQSGNVAGVANVIQSLAGRDIIASIVPHVSNDELRTRMLQQLAGLLR